MKRTLLSLLLLVSLVALPAGAVPVGYYDMSTGQGEAYMVPPITAVGQTPVQMFTLLPTELATVRERFVTNANLNVPGMGGVTTVRDFTDDANLDPVPGNTVVNGPAGVIGPTTL